MKFEYNATRVLRLDSKNSSFIEKGGGRDGDYKYSRVELLVPNDKSHAYVAIKYGSMNTVVAAVNSIQARSHNLDAKTVILILKNHAGYTSGMTRTHFITFKYESDANDFKDNYNRLSCSIKESDGTMTIRDEDSSCENNSGNNNKENNSFTGNHDKDGDDEEKSKDHGAVLTNNSSSKCSSEVNSKVLQDEKNDEDEKKYNSLNERTNSRIIDYDDWFEDEACTQDWPDIYDL